MLAKMERITPAQVIFLSFLLLFCVGTILLMLPVATRSGEGAPFLDALFTAVSASTVTGLVVHDTAQYWSWFGQMILLLLMQIGGMGVVTLALAVAMFSGRRIGLRQRWVMQEALAAPQLGGIVRVVGFILRAVILLELLGALLFTLSFCPRYGLWEGLWKSLFHSVSAFCNAGFDIMGEQVPFASLTAFRGDILVNLTVTALIILGGLGFLTWEDICIHKARVFRYRLQSKIILMVTAVLILAGFLFFFFYEFGRPDWSLSLRERLLASLFQSVSPRTAGFNTVDLGHMSPLGQMVTTLLMMVGGAPGSTAGGFKVTTLAVLVLGMLSVFRHRVAPEAFGRRVPDPVLVRASAIFMFYLLLFLAGGMALCAFDDLELMDALFEAASAMGTVGLSLGITPDLSWPSRFILIILMYFGRVGNLTVIYAVFSTMAMEPSRYPREDVTVG